MRMEKGAAARSRKGSTGFPGDASPLRGKEKKLTKATVKTVGKEGTMSVVTGKLPCGQIVSDPYGGPGGGSMDLASALRNGGKAPGAKGKTGSGRESLKLSSGGVSPKGSGEGSPKEKSSAGGAAAMKPWPGGKVSGSGRAGKDGKLPSGMHGGTSLSGMHGGDEKQKSARKSKTFESMYVICRASNPLDFFNVLRRANRTKDAGALSRCH